MLQKREQDRELVELKTKLEACTASLSTVEAEAEQVTGRMEEMKVSVVPCTLLVNVCYLYMCMMCVFVCISYRG